MKLLSLAAALGFSAASAIAGPLAPSVAPAPAPYDPIEHWEIDFETSALWGFGRDASPLDYTFLPQMLTVKTHYIFKKPFAGGDITLRNRFTLLGEPIVEGPESYFIGAAAGGSLEWWNTARSFSVFFSAGGGAGWMDSKGYEIPGGQGQDFILNWYVHTGVRWMLADRLSASLGAYFQHVSNGGQDDVNPGVNALGPTLGLGWHF